MSNTIGSVTTTHVSGGLGNSFPFEDRVHAKIGEAELHNPNEYIMIHSPQQARDVFGRGPLVDSLIQHFEEFDEALGEVPVPVLCARPENDIPGTVDPVEVAVGNSGTAPAPTSAGTPTGGREVVIRISKAGGLGTAEYRRSDDGGVNFGVPMELPANGEVSLGVGVTATFQDAAVDPLESYAVGDIFQFSIHSPKASNAKKLVCIEELKNIDIHQTPFYFFHLLGGVDRAMAVSVGTLVHEMRQGNLFRIFAVLETEPKADGETPESYFLRMQEEWDPFVNETISVVGAEGLYIAGGIELAGGYNAAAEQAKATPVYRNAATFLCARTSNNRVNVSSAWVDKNKSRTFIGIRYFNEGYKGYVGMLDSIGLSMLQIYPDYRGVFIANDRLMAGPDSDFTYIPELRRANKMHRIIYRKSLPFLKMDTEANSGTGGLGYVEAVCSAAVSEDMERPGEAEISGHKIVFGAIKKIGGKRVLPAQMTMYIRDRLDAIQWSTEFAMAGNQ